MIHMMIPFKTLPDRAGYLHQIEDTAGKPNFLEIDTGRSLILIGFFQPQKFVRPKRILKFPAPEIFFTGAVSACAGENLAFSAVGCLTSSCRGGHRSSSAAKPNRSSWDIFHSRQHDSSVLLSAFCRNE
jgi:hypothetical protein